MEEGLKIEFWKNQEKMKLYSNNKHKYRFKALFLTLLPTYLAYYNLYESKIRKYSFLIQSLIIYSVYKISLKNILNYDLDKLNDKFENNSFNHLPEK